MKIRLHNARILTMNEGEEIFLGEVHTDGSRITYVGPATGGRTYVCDARTVGVHFAEKYLLTLVHGEYACVVKSYFHVRKV